MLLMECRTALTKKRPAFSSGAIQRMYISGELPKAKHPSAPVQSEPTFLGNRTFGSRTTCSCTKTVRRTLALSQGICGFRTGAVRERTESECGQAYYSHHEASGRSRPPLPNFFTALQNVFSKHGQRTSPKILGKCRATNFRAASWMFGFV